MSGSEWQTWVDPLLEEIQKALAARGETVATAESCTGGLAAWFLTKLPGSSQVFVGSVVAYDNSAKKNILGIDDGTLREQGAVSEPVARAMAEAARERFKASYGVGITGIAGPGGGSEAKPVGTVWCGVAGPEGSTAYHFHFEGDRDEIRREAAVRALEELKRAIPH